MLLLHENCVILTSVVLSQYTRVSENDRRQTTYHGIAMKLQRSAKKSLAYLMVQQCWRKT